MIPRALSVPDPGCVGGQRGEGGSVALQGAVCLLISEALRVVGGSAWDLAEGGKCCCLGGGGVSVWLESKLRDLRLRGGESGRGCWPWGAG